MRDNKTYTLVLYAMFIAITVLLGITPLGFIMLPIAAITTMHMPVIIGSYSLGVRGGAVLGTTFGIMSLIRCFTTPDATAALVLGTETGFSAYNILLIAMVIFLPRILTGIMSALCYRGLARIDKSKIFAMAVAAFVGSLTNTVFYLGGLFVFAFDATAQMTGAVSPTYGAVLAALFTIVTTNGVIEAIAAVIICTIVGKAIEMARERQFIR